MNDTDDDPTPAEEREEARREAWDEMVLALALLSIHIGLLNTIMGQYPAEVQDAFCERVINTTEWARKQIEETHAFGESYDDPD